MDARSSRKQAIDAYRQRPADRGVFLVTCVPTGQAWVGGSQDLAAARNATWFLLRSGRNRNAALQAAWNAHGEASFRFEVIDRLDPDEPLADPADEVRRRTRACSEERGAPVLLR